MLKDVRITRKFPLIMILFALTSALVTGAVAYIQMSHALDEGARAKLNALLESRERTLHQYFANVRSDLLFHAQSLLIRSAMTEFDEAWALLPEPRHEYLQDLYIKGNPFAEKQRDHFLSADDDSEYSMIHEKYHSAMVSINSSKHFYDIFLINTDGNIVYSVKKENDFSTSVYCQQGKFGLLSIFEELTTTPHSQKVAFSDFGFYEPSGGIAAGFLAAPVFDGERKLLGVIALQLAIDTIDRIMQVTAGMGDSGETYLVGGDLTLRSDSRFLNHPSILATRVDTVAVREALVGIDSVRQIQDYRGIDVYSAYKPINVFGEKWAILAEVDAAEVRGPIAMLNAHLLLSGIILALAISMVGYYLAQDLASPILTMAAAMNWLAANKLDVNISVSDRRDEIGNMARALVSLKQTAIEREEMRAKLTFLAHHDALTGLFNREFMLEQLDDMIRRACETEQAFCLLYADIDNFKPVNDEYGHDAGDEVLQEVANRIAVCLRKEDLIGRIGGDEFLAILPGELPIERINDIGDKILKNMRRSFIIYNHRLSVGISIGLAIFSRSDMITAKELLRRADIAMYKAKSMGKNRFHIFDTEPELST